MVYLAAGTEDEELDTLPRSATYKTHGRLTRPTAGRSCAKSVGALACSPAVLSILYQTPPSPSHSTSTTIVVAFPASISFLLGPHSLVGTRTTLLLCPFDIFTFALSGSGNEIHKQGLAFLVAPELTRSSGVLLCGYKPSPHQHLCQISRDR